MSNLTPLFFKCIFCDSIFCELHFKEHHASVKGKKINAYGARITDKDDDYGKPCTVCGIIQRLVSLTK